jgi:hypothetical protein
MHRNLYTPSRIISAALIGTKIKKTQTNKLPKKINNKSLNNKIESEISKLKYRKKLATLSIVKMNNKQSYKNLKK